MRRFKGITFSSVRKYAFLLFLSWYTFHTIIYFISLDTAILGNNEQNDKPCYTGSYVGVEV